MLKKFLCVSALVVSGTVSAANIVDLYGDNPNNADRVLRKYSHEVNQLMTSLTKTLLTKDLKKDEQDFLKLAIRKKNLTEKIKQNEGYAFVDLQTIYYPDDKNSYTTIEVVRHDEKERLHYVQPKVNIKLNQRDKHDLIAKRIEFDNIEMRLINENKLNPADPCPVYHCVSGFTHAQLKPYLAIFNRGATTQKNFIIKTLKEDPNPERRAAAAFLVGHFKDPKEIISTLMPSVEDRSEGVRNNVMRVIAYTMQKAHISDINIDTILPLINSPYTTDRNKALSILSSAVKSTDGKKIILAKGKKRLVEILRLKQPNNHEFAYIILKEISGKNYSDTDIDAWQKWSLA
ncbi:Uncharacterised protein [Legionella beliardensis]|uniref:HEAT repeat n=1 Tax=Legionella beliardensis TaxID=91822 RepID=A0A378I4S7_9GAMM|nr:HEAT repeat domain-containing protein [Legionella beliardensis]STX29681.1 Uncharacterised protein [Legionella beliardensis]